MLAERLSENGPRFATAWNFGPSDEDAKPVSWIADRLARSWAEHASWTHDGAVHPQEAHTLKLDASKARACLDWHPMLPLNLALDWIVTWYRAFQEGADLRSLTRAQIEQYEALSRNVTLTGRTTSETVRKQ